MPKIRVGQDEHAYYIGFEPPLQRRHFARLPNPYGRYGSAETAGWPRMAVVTPSDAQEMVLGIYKESLVLAEIHRKSSIEPAFNKDCAANRLLDFLGKIASRNQDAVIDHRLYDIETEGGSICFVASHDDSVLGL